MLSKIHTARQAIVDDNPTPDCNSVQGVRRGNEVLAVNLPVAFPKTPQRALQNCAKKRRQLPDLSRSSASPSHGERMSTIFRDASANLQDTRSPLSKQTANTRKSRLPLSQARSKRFGSTSQEDTIPLPKSEALSHSPALPRHGTSSPPLWAGNASNRSRQKGKEREPISSGFKSSSFRYSRPPETPEEVRCPEVEHWRLPQSSSNNEPSPAVALGLFHSRPILPMLPASSPDAVEARTELENWLSDIHGSPDGSDSSKVQQRDVLLKSGPLEETLNSSNISIKEMRTQSDKATANGPKDRLRTPSQATSEKENISPAGSTPSRSRLCSPDLISTLSNPCTPDIDVTIQPPSTLHSAHPLTPQSHLSIPSRRKKVRTAAGTNLNPPKSSKDFTIHSDQVTDALAQLSPDVELRRKGRGGKRDRCISYWDEDILPTAPPSSPCPAVVVDENCRFARKGKQVLGESQHSSEMTKDKPFKAEAESAAFDFRV